MPTFPQVQPVDGAGRVIGSGGGANKINFVNLAATVQTIKGSPGTLFGLYVINNQAATACYVQVFDVATAAGVTLGTTVPDEQVYVAGTSVAFIPIPSAYGAVFNLGIQVASTTTISGNTGSSAGVYVYAFYA